jgi:serine/threonine protein kinase/Tol biopolymer transport system component
MLGTASSVSDCSGTIILSNREPSQMLTPGTRIGAYEVLDVLGVGGMGEVYRARDSRLNRDVALKVLPEAQQDLDERLARFEREAQLLASISHPNIAAIYGIEDGLLPDRGTVRALVLELVEGRTFAELLVEGPIPLDEALRLARQIVDALAAAHAQGIVHRDLKPANVKVRPDGTVKVLDFGLAKVLEPAVAADVSRSPTITSPAMTRAGIILGTAAYMSPEQARGQAADARSDIWAFGCVLYEMLGGTRAFPADGVTETLASVLRSEPDWAALPARTPRSIQRLLRRCLAKDPARRLSDVRDARLDLDETDGDPPLPLPPARSWLTRERVAWVAALGIAVLVAFAAQRSRGPTGVVTPEAAFVHLALPPTTAPASFAISPDGRQVAFVASNGGQSELWLRSLENGTQRVLRGTAGATYPFWSPDSRSIAFFNNEVIHRIEVDGGAPRRLAFAPVGTGGSWSKDGTIVFTPVPDGVVAAIAADTGNAVALPTTNEPVLIGQRFPQFLPDDRHFLYYEVESRAVMLGSRDTAERRRLFEADASAIVAGEELIYVLDGAVFAQRFDPAGFSLIGDRVRLGENVAIDWRGAAALSASRTGVVLFRTGTADEGRHIGWYDRRGQLLRTVVRVDDNNPLNLDLSSDGRRVVLNRSVDGNSDIYEVELEHGTPRRITTGKSPDIVAVYASDDRSILFTTVGSGGGLFQRRLDASSNDRVLPGNASGLVLTDWAHDYVVYRARSADTGWDIWAKKVQEAAPFAVVRTPAEERVAQLSPDARWIAYESNEDPSGGFDVYVQRIPTGEGKQRVSAGGGSQIRWVGDEIFYISGAGDLVSVRTMPTTMGGIALGERNSLFRAPLDHTVQGGVTRMYAVSADAQQFLIITPIELPSQALTLILHRTPQK